MKTWTRPLSLRRRAPFRRPERATPRPVRTATAPARAAEPATAAAAADRLLSEVVAAAMLVGRGTAVRVVVHRGLRDARTLEAFRQKWVISEGDPSLGYAWQFGRTHRKVLMKQFLPRKLRRSRLGAALALGIEHAALIVGRSRYRRPTSN